MSNLISGLKQPWGDQVKGSWWKAPLVIVGYFYLRLLSELWILQRGINEAEISLVPDLLIEETAMQEIMRVIEGKLLLQSVILLAAVMIVCRMLGFNFFDFKTFTKQNVYKALIFFAGMYGVQIVLNVLIIVFAPDYTQPANQAAVESLVNNMNIAVMFVYIVIITPMIEEYILRGLIMKYTFSLMPFTGALVSCVLFTLLHGPSNFIDFIIYFVLSAGLTIIYWHTRRLEYPILLHTIQNFIGFIGIQLL